MTLSTVIGSDGESAADGNTIPTFDLNDSHQSNMSRNPFWSQDQLVTIDSVPYGVHLFLGFFVSLIGTFGMTANATVLIIFSRFKRLRSPTNIFIINLALADLSASCLHPMAAYSNFNGRWAFGQIGCQLYALGVFFFGLVSILTFSAIAVERCLVITSSPLGLSKWKITRTRAKTLCVWIWLYCGVLVVLPFFGLSAYIPEGFMTTCSWDYRTRTLSNRIYYILLLTTGFLLPVCLIVASYGQIISSVVRHARLMVSVTQHNSSASALRKLSRQMEIRTAKIFIALFIVYLTAWTPYSIVTFIGQFGPEDYLTPYSTAIPAYFAKIAVVVDPLVYGFSHPQFRKSFRHYLASLPCGGHSDGSPPDQQPSAAVVSCQSKNLTIYPNNNGAECGRDHQRRMLRTFRDLSADNSKPNSVIVNPLDNML